MILRRWHLMAASVLVGGGLAISAPAETHYVAAGNPSALSPYTNWATAAATIQEAVDDAATNDTVLVSNGVYMADVSINKPLTVRSVNGAGATLIDGAKSMRGVYMADGAVLAGFTVTNGLADYGGGIWCESDLAVVSNCVLTGNFSGYGGGAYHGTLYNCVVVGNSVMWDGGGVYEASLYNCNLAGNSASWDGGGAYDCVLYNCSLVGNAADDGGGTAGGELYNCIVYDNTANNLGDNHTDAAMAYCCTTPDPGGTGNITNMPRMASISHLSTGSPCIGAGSTNYSRGRDIDGEAWRSSPAIGCDEYRAGVVTGPVSVAIGTAYTNITPARPVAFTALITGRLTASRWSFGDGTVVSNQPYVSHAWSTAGVYTVTLTAVNEDHVAGVSTSLQMSVITWVRYVNVSNALPQAPYTNWVTAATNIQDALNEVVLPGELILVTNGVYDAGSTDADGSPTRVRMIYPVRLKSVNGPAVTIIDGGGSVRGVYMTNGAVLSGFTVANGYTAGNGGGVYTESKLSIVTNCILFGNSAYSGGGIYRGTL